MLDYKRIKELNDKYYYSESKKAYIDKSTKSAIDLSEAERMEYECAKYLSSVLFQTMKDKKMDVCSKKRHILAAYEKIGHGAVIRRGICRENLQSRRGHWIHHGQIGIAE